MTPVPVRLAIADADAPPGPEPAWVAGVLRFAGFDVSIAEGGRGLLRVVAAEPVDLVLLDVDLPDLDGFEVLRRLQAQPPVVPVLVMSARHTTADKVRALHLGADDYVTKPFNVEEVLARIRAILRRTRGSRAPGGPRISVADLELDVTTHDVWRAGDWVKLSATEFRLLRYMMLNSGRVRSKEEIFDNVWPPGSVADPTVVESYISYVRRKVDRRGPRLIHTLRGVGYLLRAPSQ
jgi:two-component system OmpR family response regulator